MDRSIRARLGRAVASLLDISSYRVLFWRLNGRMLNARQLPDVRPVALIIPAAPAGGKSAALIPPVIFQTWKSRSAIPRNYYYWRTTFQSSCPGYSLVLWDDADNRRFIEDRHAWFLPTYLRYPSEIFRADIIRLFFLYSFGGVYADMDTECLTSLDGLRRNADVVLGQMGADKSFEHSIPNAIMASRPHQGFWLVAIALALQYLAGLSADEMARMGPERLTGPVLIKSAYEFYQRANREQIAALLANTVPPEMVEGAEFGYVTLLGPRALYPLSWTNRIHRLLIDDMRRDAVVPDRPTAHRIFPGSYVVTYWSHSWS